jgi:TonB-linked SusC/RagA family outer membrane protein
MKKLKKLVLCGLLTSLWGTLAAQNVTVLGTVTDLNGALPGATIAVKGTTTATVSDVNGSYVITVSGGDAVLVFSFLGYTTQEITVGGRTTIDVTLVEDTKALDEVVVVGYGVQKKANLTGAVSSVKMDEVLGNRPVSSVTGALMGNIPGLILSGNSAEPGSGYDIKIRGTSSINGGDPLILVDNIPMNISDINPEDIEAVSVLKDASAAAIYGARAAFGVILITTKQAQKDKPARFNFSSKLAFSSPQELATRATPLQTITAMKDAGYINASAGQNIDTWMDLLNQYNANPSLYPEGYAMAGGTRYSLQETDLTRDMIDNFGVKQMYDFSVSGGSGKSAYRISLGVLDDDGVLVTDKDSYSRYNVSSFLSTDVTPWMTAQLSLLYSNSKKSDPNALSISRNVWELSVYSPSYYPVGGIDINDVYTPFYTPRHILEAFTPDISKSTRVNILGRIILKPFEGLTITGEYSTNNAFESTTTYRKPMTFADGLNFGILAPNITESTYREEKMKTVYNALNLFATYNKRIQDHDFTLTAGLNAEHNDYDDLWVSRLQMINDELPSIGQGVGLITAEDDFSEYAILGCFYRLNYSFKDKYLFEASGRYDGSSKFPESNRFGFFPSFSAGWRISEEGFMEGIRQIVSNLKLRASWGSIGNQNIDPYSYTPGMAAYLSNWLRNGQRATSLQPAALVRTNFTWEEVRTQNLGIDLGLFGQKLNGSFDIFKRQTLNMLGPGLDYPAIVGTVAPLQNAADMETNGWELQVSWRDKIGEVSYGLGFNISDNISKITKFKNDTKILGNYYDGMIHYEGMILGELWGYEVDRFYTVDDFVDGTLTTTAAGALTGGTLKPGVPKVKGYNPNPGDFLYKHADENGEIWSSNNTADDPGSQRIIGNSSYRYVFGINADVSWKGFSLSILLQGVGKRQVWLRNAMTIPYTIAWANGIYSHQLDYWTPENTDAQYARLYNNGQYNTVANGMVNDRYLLDASYLDIKSVTLSYDLPKSLISKIKLEKVTVFVNGENLWSFNHFPEGIHPDNQTRGSIGNGGGATYPIMRLITGGVNITF